MLLAELKNQTRPQHDALEKDLDLLREDLTLSEYQDLLQAFWGFYVPFERMLQKSNLPEALRNRAKVPWLEADLHYWGIHLREIPEAPSHFFDRLRSPEEIWGALYVLEGSTLGAQVLIRHFSRVLGISDEKGMKYFAGYGEETLLKWREFQKLLEESSQQGALKQDVIIRSAQTTFEQLHLWLKRSPSSRVNSARFR